MSFWSNVGKAASIFSEGVVSSAEEFAKASKDPAGKSLEASEEDPQGLVWDPFSIIESLGYKDKPSAITYGTLQSIVWKTPIIQGIILTRLNQISSFARPQQDKFETGFRVRLADKSVRMSPADNKRSKQIESMFSSCGVIKDSILERTSFEQFLRAIGRDSLTYDQMNFEICNNRKGQPAAFYAADASTIRLADTASVSYTYDPDKIYTVQIYDNMVVNQWTKDRMAFCVRNPHTNIRLYGYGVSEIEMLIDAVTAILWAFSYNQKFFSQGSVAKGLLNIKGQMNQKQLRAFRRHWYQMISGVENAWRSPVLNSSEGAEWVDMSHTNRDMEFSAWMDFLIKLIAGIFQMDPLELNFKYGNSGEGKSMFEAGNKEKLTASKDKGLRPFLHFIEEEFTRYIVRPIEDDFVFEFVGLERETKKELADLNAVRVKSSHTLNEIRQEQDLPPVEEGDIVLDPTYVQHLNNLEQQKQQQSQMSMQQDQMLMDGMGGITDPDKEESGEQKPPEDDKKDQFGEDDFAGLQDRTQGTAGPAGKISKSIKRHKVKILEMEI